jgi:hypothetical protein
MKDGVLMSRRKNWCETWVFKITRQTGILTDRRVANKKGDVVDQIE